MPEDKKTDDIKENTVQTESNGLQKNEFIKYILLKEDIGKSHIFGYHEYAELLISGCANVAEVNVIIKLINELYIHYKNNEENSNFNIFDVEKQGFYKTDGYRKYKPIAYLAFAKFIYYRGDYKRAIAINEQIKAYTEDKWLNAFANYRIAISYSELGDYQSTLRYLSLSDKLLTDNTSGGCFLKTLICYSVAKVCRYIFQYELVDLKLTEAQHYQTEYNKIYNELFINSEDIFKLNELSVPGIFELSAINILRKNVRVYRKDEPLNPKEDSKGYQNAMKLFNEAFKIISTAPGDGSTQVLDFNEKIENETFGNLSRDLANAIYQIGKLCIELIRKIRSINKQHSAEYYYYLTGLEYYPDILNSNPEKSKTIKDEVDKYIKAENKKKGSGGKGANDTKVEHCIKYLLNCAKKCNETANKIWVARNDKRGQAYGKILEAEIIAVNNKKSNKQKLAECYNESIKIFHDINNTRGLIVANIRFALLYKYTYDIIRYLNYAEDYAKISGNRYSNAHVYVLGCKFSNKINRKSYLDKFEKIFPLEIVAYSDTKREVFERKLGEVQKYLKNIIGDTKFYEINKKNKLKLYDLENENNFSYTNIVPDIFQNLTINEDINIEFQESKELIGKKFNASIEEKINKLAGCDEPVFITGNTGVGKSLIADIIHYNSMRNNNRILQLNCGVIPRNLIQSELFGYVPGAFTGGNPKGEDGLIKKYEGGTLFLDEIDQAPEIWNSLLQLIEEGEFKRVGGNTLIKANVRIITASNKDLEVLISQNKFPVDLYSRLTTHRLKVDDLGKRPEDLEELIPYFIKKYRLEYSKFQVESVDERSLEEIKKFTFYANVRSLKNLINVILLNCNDEKIIKYEDIEEILKKEFEHDKNISEAIKVRDENLKKNIYDIIHEISKNSDNKFELNKNNSNISE